MPPAAVLWDLDGTLVDSRADIAAAANVARAAIGLAPLPETAVAGMVGDGMGTLLHRLAPEADEATRGALRAAFITYYEAHCADATAPFPGVVEVVAAVAAAGIAQGVVTNKPLAFTRRILSATGLGTSMGTVQGGDAARKPAPDQLLAGCRELAVDPGACWMVGDHHTDLLAGRAAGCRTAFCAWGIGHPGEAEPDVCLSVPGDLLAVLEVAAP